MEFSLEGLIIAVFAILPGFVSGAVRLQLDPTEKAATGEWVAVSIVTSIVLNGVIFLPFVMFGHWIDFGRAVQDLGAQLGVISGWQALAYLGVLYLLAIVWGILSALIGAGQRHRLLGYRFRLTPVSGLPNTFIDAIDSLVSTRANRRLRGDAAQQVPWLRVLRSDLTILGRMTKSSDQFALSEPPEVFLDPAYIFNNRTVAPRENDVDYPAGIFKGLYLRLKPEDVVEVLVARADWTPQPPRVAVAADFM